MVGKSAGEQWAQIQFFPDGMVPGEGVCPEDRCPGMGHIKLKSS